MIKHLLLIVGLALSSACATVITADTDQSGNVYPVDCQGDLLDEPTTVLRAELGMQAGRKRLGLWSPGLILIDQHLSGWKYDDALRHERCHARMMRLHPETKGEWHSRIFTHEDRIWIV